MKSCVIFTRQSEKKRLIICIAFFMVLMILFVSLSDISVFASTVKLVDNDDTQGHDNLNYNDAFSGYNSSSCYANNYRIKFYSSPGYYYEYIYNSSVQKTGSLSVSLSVYLNHLQFTDPEAVYRVYYRSSAGSSESYVSRSINQDTAAAGWNDLSTMVISSGSSYTYYSRRTQVRCSNNIYENTGADAIYASYS